MKLIFDYAKVHPVNRLLLRVLEAHIKPYVTDHAQFAIIDDPDPTKAATLHVTCDLPMDQALEHCNYWAGITKPLSVDHSITLEAVRVPAQVPAAPVLDAQR
jgi:hypothetical protein